MKVLVLLFLFSIISITAGRHGTRSGKIIGGHDARPNSHPYLVALQTRFFWARFRLCSGSLLSDRWILTAGHCVKGSWSWLSNWLTIEAVVGTNDLEQKASTTQTVRIAERIPHPFYKGGIGAYDIAMLRTEKKIEYNNAVSPIGVPFSMGSYTDDVKNLILAGWGVLETTSSIPILPDKLQEARVEYLPFNDCYKAIDAVKESYEDNPLDRKANICTGPVTGGIAACSGDSGGPLIQYISYDGPQSTTSSAEGTTWADSSSSEMESTEENMDSYSDFSKESQSVEKELNVADLVEQYKDDGLIPVVIGVVSWGISPCGEVGAPTVYTNVSTYAYFIQQHLNNNN